MGDLAEPAEDLLEELRGQGQAVAARDEHVADLGRPAEVLELGLVLLAVEVLGRVADDPAPGAVAAVARALGRDEHQDPVRVAMDEARDRRVAVLGERVLHHRGERLLLTAERDDLAPDRVVGVLRVDQADEVGRDVDPELVRGAEAVALLVGQLQDLLDLLEVVDPVAELPAPVVPLLVGDVGPDRGAPADRGPTVRPERLGGVAPVHEGRLGGRGHGGLVGDRRLDLLGVHAGLLRDGPSAVGHRGIVDRRAGRPPGDRRIKSMQSASPGMIPSPARRGPAADAGGGRRRRDGLRGPAPASPAFGATVAEMSPVRA